MKNDQIIKAYDSCNPSQADKDRLLAQIMRDANETSYSRLKPRRVLAVALAVLLILGASAFALNEGGLINWFGEKVVENMPTLTDHKEAIATINERAGKAMAMFEKAPENELWVAEIWENTQIVHSPTKRFDTAEALAAHLDAAGLSFPAHIPAGYNFTSGSVYPYLSEDTASSRLLPLDDEQTEAGFTIKKYRLPDGYADEVESWSAKFGDDKGNFLSLTGFRDSNSTQYSFNTSVKGEHEILTIPGMTEALYIHNKDNRFEHSLNFRQAGLPQIFHYNWYSPRMRPDVKLIPNYYDSLVYELGSNALDKDTLLQIAESMK